MIMEDEYEGIDEDNEDIKWRTLSPKERVQFLHLIFEDPDWYNGAPYFEGGNTNPDFDTICDRSGAPKKEVQRYYATWLNRRGLAATGVRTTYQHHSAPTTQQVFNNTATTTPPPTAIVLVNLTQWKR